MNLKPKCSSQEDCTLYIDKKGQDIIHNPLLNKGTAFTADERKELGLEGLLPPHITTIEEQLSRLRVGFDNKNTRIGKYIFLRALQDRNEVLFYAFARKYVEEVMPIIYTPTVGDAVKSHGRIHRFARGLFLTTKNIEQMDDMVDSLPSKDIEIIVVTDSEAILGIGDQGVGGMGIPIGKLSLYTVGAGVHPASCLPICLDVGTNNKELLDDPMYLGIREERMVGEEYDQFIDKFVQGIKRNFPNAVLQWEDFSKQKAFTLMDRYMEELPSFNDDIQGTGAVVLSGIMAAMRIKKEKITDQRYAIYGAGAGGIGISRQIKDALLLEGLSEQQAAERVFVVDSQGLITSDREGLDDYKKLFAYDESKLASWVRQHIYTLTLEDVVMNGKITVLIGASGQGDSFKCHIVDQMMKNCDRPIIMPLSNPNSNAEADPRWLLEYTGAKAIVASGSPFPNKVVDGVEYQIGQGNNAFIFPGVGLGLIAAKINVVRPSFFTVAAYEVAAAVQEERLAVGALYPAVEMIFEVSLKVAVAVYHQAIKEGVGTPLEGEAEEEIRKMMWIPKYPTYKFDDGK